VSSVILEVRALEQRGTDTRRGTYLRAGHVFEPGWNEYVVDESEVAVLQGDPWLQVRTMDPRTQAAKRMEAALAADTALQAEESAVKAKRAKVNALLAEAEAGLDAVGNEPPPPAAEPATPFQDALMAAMPSTERAKVDAKKKK
jgi:hypothetical protein